MKVRDGDKCKQCGAQDLHFQEKGVDVKIGVDIVIDSHNDQIAKMVLVSSDTDLIPAVETALEKEKHLVYVGFSDKLTNALLNVASETQIIRDPESLFQISPPLRANLAASAAWTARHRNTVTVPPISDVCHSPGWLSLARRDLEQAPEIIEAFDNANPPQLESVAE